MSFKTIVGDPDKYLRLIQKYFALIKMNEEEEIGVITVRMVSVLLKGKVFTNGALRWALE